MAIWSDPKKLTMESFLFFARTVKDLLVIGLRSIPPIYPADAYRRRQRTNVEEMASIDEQ
jgi:hypothetical protein